MSAPIVQGVLGFKPMEPETMSDTLALVSEVFLRERLVSFLGVDQQALVNFLEPFLEEVAIPYGNSILAEVDGDRVGFVVSEPFPAPPASTRLEQGISEELAKIFAIMERLDQILLTNTDLAQGEERRGLVFSGLGEIADRFQAALNAPGGSRVSHTLMAGVLEEHMGHGYAIVLEGLRRAYLNGNDFSVAETTNPQSTAISLRHGCQVVARAAYAEFELGDEKPFSEIPPWHDWNPDINPTGDRQRIFPSGCRLVVLDLEHLAGLKGWQR